MARQPERYRRGAVTSCLRERDSEQVGGKAGLWLKERPDTSSHIRLEEGSSIRSTDLPQFHIEIHPQRDVVRVVPAGELDLATAPKLEAQLRELREAGFRHVVLDLRLLTFLDSTGIRLILGESGAARRSGRDFMLIRGGATVQRVLDISGLSGQLRFVAASPVPAPPQRAPAIRHDPPELGIAFQRYLAGLRHHARHPAR